MKHGTLYRLEVAPLTVLPLNRSPFFSYVTTTITPPGTLLLIPFGRKTLRGIVYRSDPLPQSTAPSWMKRPIKIIQTSLLTTGQLHFAEYIAKETFSPLGRVLVHFVHPRAKERKQKKEKKETPQEVTPSGGMARSLVSKTLRSKKKPHLWEIGDETLREESLALLALRVIEKKQQCLILVPEIHLVVSLGEALKRHIPDLPLSLFHGRIATGAQTTLSDQLVTKTPRVVVSTRQGLFLPFTTLGAVIVTDEENESYKQWDMTPRYDARSLVSFLASHFRCPLVFVSPAPSIARFHSNPKAPIAIHTLPSPLGELHLVNLREERYRKNYSLLSRPLHDALTHTLSKKEKSVLFLEQSGYSRLVLCLNCKSVYRCPTCSALLVPASKGKYACRHCPYESPLFPSCPTCHHLEFRNIGCGIDRVRHDIEKAFPRARIVSFSGDSMKTSRALVHFEKTIREGDFDILLGTHPVLYGPPIKHLSLIGILDADRFFSLPDFRSDERLVSAVTRSRLRVPTGKVLVQTFQPESIFSQKIQGESIGAYREASLAERELLRYPPFSRLIMIDVLRPTSEEARRDADTLLARLRDGEKASRWSTFRIDGPRRKIRGKISERILLKVFTLDHVPDELLSLLTRLPPDTFLDVDPVSWG